MNKNNGINYQLVGISLTILGLQTHELVSLLGFIITLVGLIVSLSNKDVEQKKKADK